MPVANSVDSRLLEVDVWPLSALEAYLQKYPHVLQTTLANFTCAKSSRSEEFLRECALDLDRLDLCRTFLLLDAAQLRMGIVALVGYIAVASRVLPITGRQLDERYSTLGKSRRSVAATLRRLGIESVVGRDVPARQIVHFARSDHYSHSQLPGESLLRIAEDRIYEAAFSVGGIAILIDAPAWLSDWLKSLGYEEVGDLPKPQLVDDGGNLLMRYVKDINPYRESRA